MSSSCAAKTNGSMANQLKDLIHRLMPHKVWTRLRLLKLKRGSPQAGVGQVHRLRLRFLPANLPTLGDDRLDQRCGKEQHDEQTNQRRGEDRAATATAMAMAMVMIDPSGNEWRHYFASPELARRVGQAGEIVASMRMILVAS